MTIRFKQNSIEFDNGIRTFTLNEVSGGFTFNGQLAASDFYGGFQGTVAGYTSGGNPTTNVIDKFPFATNANATDVGDLTQSRFNSSSQSSKLSGYTAGGSMPAAQSSNVIDKFPFATNANATDVGDLTFSGGSSAGQSSSTHGYTAGFGDGNGNRNRFSFASDENATSLTNLLNARGECAGNSSSTHGYTSGGNGYNTIEKFPFASDSNSTNVGNLSPAIPTSPSGATRGSIGHSSSLSGYVAGFYTPAALANIEKFPFSTDANAANVGNLTQARSRPAGQSSTGFGYTSGGYIGFPSIMSNVIDRFPFSTDSNATDVGDLTVARNWSKSGHQY